jgi:hypothetical protein
VAIISGSRNPKNDSRFARRRSILKGRTNQLTNVINGLKTASDKMIFEEFIGSTSDKPHLDFGDAWGRGHMKHRQTGPGEKLDVRSFEPKLDRIPNQELKSDFRLILADFTTLKTRFAADPQNRGYICMFVGKNRLELIASKWGLTVPTGSDHHFFHWQAVARGGSVQRVVTVDDASLSDDDSSGGSKKADLLDTLTTAGLW